MCWPGLVVHALALGCLAGELPWPLDPGLACDPMSTTEVSSLGGNLAASSPELGSRIVDGNRSSWA
jgi:hypothetical protein